LRELPKPKIILHPEPRVGRWKYLRVPILVIVIVGATFTGWQIGLNQGSGALGKMMEDGQQLQYLTEALAGSERVIAVSQREAQVTQQANEELKQQIVELENIQAGLKADVAFYQRLLDSGSNTDGLAVYDLKVETITPDQLYRYRLTLSQNLKKANPVSGQLEISIEGAQDGQLLVLDDGQLHVRPEQNSNYEFKYFQQLEGSFRIPIAFKPERVEVRMRPKSKKETDVVRSFTWADLIKT